MIVEEIYLNTKILVEDGHGGLPVYVSDDQGNYGELSVWFGGPIEFTAEGSRHIGGNILDKLEYGDMFINAGMD